MTIHTFGDSHVSNAWQSMLNVKINYHIGPRLCYSIVNESLNIQNFGVVENDIVVFSFGEIDCRCHVHKHITESKTYQMIIDSLVNRYIEFIKKEVSGFKNIHPCLYPLPPPVDSSNTPEDKDYPFRGTNEERKLYYLYFNKQAKAACESTNITYIDVYDKYADSNGFLNKSLSDGLIHIRNPIFIKEFMNSRFKLPMYYTAPGTLGDFILELSVICENWKKTGRKGILLIENPLTWRKSLEDTYKDTYELISTQPYIQEYHIYQGLPPRGHIDVNLLDWRYSPLLYKANWYSIYKSTYGVEWGSHQWLYLPLDEKWESKVFISYPTYRDLVDDIDYKMILEKYGKENVYFISQNKEDYDRFQTAYHLDIEFVQPSTLFEFVVMIRSCKLFIGALSAPLTIAFASYTPCVPAMPPSMQDHIHNINLQNVIPFIQYSKNFNPHKAKEIL